MLIDLFKNFKIIYSIFPKKFKIKYIIFIFLSFLASILEFFSISLLIPLVAAFTGDPTLMKVFNDKLGLDFLYLDKAGIDEIIIIFLAAYSVKFLFLLYLTFYRNLFIFSLQKELFLKLYKSYIFRNYSFHLNNNSSILLRNLLQNIQQLTVGFISSYNNIILETLIIISLTVLMFMFQTKITLFVILSLALIIFLVLILIKNKTYKLGTDKQKYYARNLRNVMESLEGIKEIKIFQREKKMINKVDHDTTLVSKNNYYIQFLNETPRLVFEFAAICSSLLLLYVFINLNYAIESIISYFIIIFAIIIRILPSTNKIMSSFITLSVSKAAVELVTAELKNENIFWENKSLLNKKKVDFNNKINLENISFSYKKKNEEKTVTLNNISLSINKGDMIGLIGETGSGKSTLIDLLIGLIKPQSGSVYVDGININENYQSWLSKIGYVPQNVFLTDSNVVKNILFDENTSNIDREKLNKVVKSAQLEKFISKSPAGLETIVGERGSNLSGGQKQRIGIARALYHSCELLIFDESTSALDETTQKKFIDEIGNLKGLKTVLISSHNKNSLVYCDTIYELKKEELKKVK